MISIRTASHFDLPDVLALWRAATTEPSMTDDHAGVDALLARDPTALIVASDQEPARAFWRATGCTQTDQSRFVKSLS